MDNSMKQIGVTTFFQFLLNHFSNEQRSGKNKLKKFLRSLKSFFYRFQISEI